MQKLIIVGLSGLILGGCNLTQNWQQQAFRDDKSQEEVIITESKDQDPEFVNVLTVSDNTDEVALEQDLNQTVILEEDFGDLEL